MKNCGCAFYVLLSDGHHKMKLCTRTFFRASCFKYSKYILWFKLRSLVGYFAILKVGTR